MFEAGAHFFERRQRSGRNIRRLRSRLYRRGAPIQGIWRWRQSHLRPAKRLRFLARLLVVRQAKGDGNRDRRSSPWFKSASCPSMVERRRLSLLRGIPCAWPRRRRKARLTADTLNQLLNAKEVMGDTRLFFRDIAQDLPIHSIQNWR